MYTSTCVQEVLHEKHQSFVTAAVQDSDIADQLIVDLPPEHNTPSVVEEHMDYISSESVIIDDQVVDLPPEHYPASESIFHAQQIVDLPLEHSAASTPVILDQDITTSNASNFVTHRYVAVNEAHPKVYNNDEHSDDTRVVRALCHVCKTTVIEAEQRFFQSELLGTVVEPRFGGCRCSKCPVPGSLYSFKEQKQYDKIQGLLYRVIQNLGPPYRAKLAIAYEKLDIAFSNTI